MTPSVSPEADRELTDGAVYYAKEADAVLGLAFIAEFERALDLLCGHPQLGAPWREARCAGFHTASFTTSRVMSSASSRWRITGASLLTGPAVNDPGLLD
jgi:plasmid stabilization system protein ParE